MRFILLLFCIIYSFSEVIFAEETSIKKDKEIFNLETQKEQKDFASKLKDFIFDESYKNDPNFTRHRLEIEGGIAQIIYNKIGNNSNTGALFNLKDINDEINFYTRYSYYFNLDKKNEFKIMIAPFKINNYGYLSDSFNYDGIDYDENTPVYASYQFNSYRFTYRRKFFDSNKIKFRLGVTFKIREAMIQLSQGESSSVDRNVGFVPLLHINFEYHPISNNSNLDKEIKEIKEKAIIYYNKYEDLLYGQKNSNQDSFHLSKEPIDPQNLFYKIDKNKNKKQDDLLSSINLPSLFQEKSFSSQNPNQNLSFESKSYKESVGVVQFSPFHLSNKSFKGNKDLSQPVSQFESSLSLDGDKESFKQLNQDPSKSSSSLKSIPSEDKVNNMYH